MGRKILSFFMAITVAVSLSACQTEDTGHTSSLSETAVSEPSAQTAETTAPEKSAEVLLPDGWTMDELRNILIINGETLTLPTTLNKIMELDENFSYEAEYVDEKSPLYTGKKGFYVDVTYNDVFMFTTSFLSDVNDVNTILDKDVCCLSFGKTNCQKANLTVDLSCDLSFGSSFEEITNIFKEPNVYNYDDTNKEFEFYNNEYKCKLFFEINSENVVSFFKVNIAPITVSEPSVQTEDAVQTAETTAPVKPNDYPAYPLPEGWTFEKIINLIEIDGVPLSLKFIDNNFENVSEKITIKSEDFVNNYYHDIWYNNDRVAIIGKYDDEEYISSLLLGYAFDDQEIIDSITFAGYKLTEIEDIYNYLDESFVVSYENDSTKSRKYIIKDYDEQLIIDILCHSEYTPNRLTMIIYIE